MHPIIAHPSAALLWLTTSTSPQVNPADQCVEVYRDAIKTTFNLKSYSSTRNELESLVCNSEKKTSEANARLEAGASDANLLQQGSVDGQWTSAETTTACQGLKTSSDSKSLLELAASIANDKTLSLFNTCMSLSSGGVTSHIDTPTSSTATITLIWRKRSPNDPNTLAVTKIESSSLECPQEATVREILPKTIRCKRTNPQADSVTITFSSGETTTLSLLPTPQPNAFCPPDALCRQGVIIWQRRRVDLSGIASGSHTLLLEENGFRPGAYLDASFTATVNQYRPDAWQQITLIAEGSFWASSELANRRDPQCGDTSCRFRLANKLRASPTGKIHTFLYAWAQDAKAEHPSVSIRGWLTLCDPELTRCDIFPPAPED